MNMRFERMVYEPRPGNPLREFCKISQQQEKELPPERRFKSGGGIESQLALYTYWGAVTDGAFVDGELVGVNVYWIQKREWPVWGRYVKHYVVYVAPENRRAGIAEAMVRHGTERAYEVGCVRFTTRTQSYYGTVFFHAMGHQFWGRAKNGELIVDTPLDDRLYPDVVPEPLYKNKGAVLYRMTRLDIAGALLTPPFRASKERVEKWLSKTA